MKLFEYGTLEGECIGLHRDQNAWKDPTTVGWWPLKILMRIRREVVLRKRCELYRSGIYIQRLKRKSQVQRLKRARKFTVVSKS